MTLEFCEPNEVPELAVNVPAEGTHGYEDLFPGHRDFWQAFALDAERDCDAAREVMGQVMHRMFARSIEGADAFDLAHYEDPNKLIRVHRLGIVAMSFFLQELITPDVVLVDGIGSTNPATGILDLMPKENGEEPYGYQLYLPGVMKRGTKQWYQGANNLFVCKAPANPELAVTDFLASIPKKADFSQLTVNTPYLASR